MRLYSRHLNSAGWRVRIALHVKGLAFDYVPVAELGEDERERVNPLGVMPALEVEGAVVAQSLAILEFLEERFPEPPLLPADALTRAAVRGFSQIVACDLHPLNSKPVRDYLADPLGHSEPEILTWYRHWMARGLGRLDSALQRRGGPGPFCFGPAPSLADVHLVPLLYNSRRYDCDLTPFPALLTAEAACREQPGFRAAAPEFLSDFRGQQEPWLEP